MKKYLPFLCIISLLLLNGCGGGNSSNINNYINEVSNTQTNISERNMTQEELALITRLNNERVSIGLNTLTPNKRLSYSAYKHGIYCLENECTSHYEDKNRAKYYATTPYDRAIKAGYNKGYIGEVFTFNAKEPIYMLLNSLSHRSLLLKNFQDVGLAIVKEQSNTYVVIDFGGYNNQYPDIIKYPEINSKVFNFFKDREIPHPIGENNITGYPVSIYFKTPFDINKEHKFIIKDEDGNILEQAAIINKTKNMNEGYEDYAFPKNPLEINKTYSVTFKYYEQNSNEEKNITWSFNVDKDANEIFY